MKLPCPRPACSNQSVSAAEARLAGDDSRARDLAYVRLIGHGPCKQLVIYLEVTQRSGRASQAADATPHIVGSGAGCVCIHYTWSLSRSARHLGHQSSFPMTNVPPVMSYLDSTLQLITFRRAGRLRLSGKPGWSHPAAHRDGILQSISPFDRYRRNPHLGNVCTLSLLQHGLVA